MNDDRPGLVFSYLSVNVSALNNGDFRCFNPDTHNLIEL
ncbi:Unknown protein sequence [Pseudomonas savastanoi pv. glycinea]|uniref:Uncharacterized protein n=5 Tax=Pseudomonas syringae group genomosp. 2 TaxID=251698 RepID=A0A3M5LLC3_PSESS|nr:carbon storage regulator related protein [Pseudomonas savastanoi]KPC32474.1 Unknown protein sequence [Pseudomonas savastanoi pv. glycinea]KPW08514.1 Unknown protein sequence [Pseudomonas amygdali pv. aesculi]KPX27171.1 Unknown protein sequence [Pseudomonas amygdali pv. eriobotryae]KPX67619.1 Unknown protein sequence [Pseudomonas amygdali pv. photiniae]KPY00854.1 Unknown protein sequence [Pseudomonas amygdali pv. myricae]KPY65183.1 Unknown protein sequence [Pseudomonas savastanoi pv. savast